MKRGAMTNTRTLLRAMTVALALCTLSACGKGGAGADERPPLADAAVGGPFTLIDKNGKTVHWSDFDGRYRIVYFGYTFCPDACPTDMNVIGQALAKLDKKHPELTARIVPLFITVDPARDTPQVVGQFAAAFSPRVIGLTGTKDEIDKAAKEFAVYYEKGASTPGGYLINHSRTVYLMGTKGEPIAILPADQGPDAVAAEILKWVK
ncbi:MAG: SCO family protein [Sphingomonadales bacterium]|nr:SCO family protein [Sphingomonadales bacterium]MDE2171628.1 SCO family protein [Sphingomonadales bacterium]